MKKLYHYFVLIIFIVSMLIFQQSHASADDFININTGSNTGLIIGASVVGAGLIGGVLLAALSSGGGSNGNNTNSVASDNASGNAVNNASDNANTNTNTNANTNTDPNSSASSKLISKNAAVKTSKDGIVCIGEKKKLFYTLTMDDFEDVDKNDYVHIYNIQLGSESKPILEQKYTNEQTKQHKGVVANKKAYKLSIDVEPKIKETYFVRIEYCDTKNVKGAKEIEADSTKLRTKDINIEIIIKDRGDLDNESVSKDGMMRLIKFIQDKGDEFDKAKTEEQKNEKSLYILGLDQSADCSALEIAYGEKKNNLINTIGKVFEFNITASDNMAIQINNENKLSQINNYIELTQKSIKDIYTKAYEQINKIKRCPLVPDDKQNNKTNSANPQETLSKNQPVPSNNKNEDSDNTESQETLSQEILNKNQPAPSNNKNEDSDNTESQETLNTNQPAPNDNKNEDSDNAELQGLLKEEALLDKANTKIKFIVDREGCVKKYGKYKSSKDNMESQICAHAILEAELGSDSDLIKEAYGKILEKIDLAVTNNKHDKAVKVLEKAREIALENQAK